MVARHVGAGVDQLGTGQGRALQPCALVSVARYGDDGRIEIDNWAAERALRGVALGRNNYLFMGSDDGGERAASLYSLLETAMLNGPDPEGYLRDALARIGEHPINRVDELLPWNIAGQQLRKAA
ncbi:MAG: transposase [Ramlibacter sp.]|nr:transposase [Ramlibacter sp.]